MKNKIRNYALVDDSFGYLMHLLYKNNMFSELHLPSLNSIKIEGNLVKILKIIPPEFKSRIEEIEKLLNNSPMTNIEIKENFIEKNNLYLLINSKLGHICKNEELTIKEKRKIIKLFFKYHKEINNPTVKVNTNYHTFFCENKFKKDISILKNRINSNKKIEFDKKVLNYLDLISQQDMAFDYSGFKQVNVHGDFVLKNIIQNGKDFSLIDLDMLHEGYLEIQIMILLSELFGFSTKEFFENFKYCYNTLNLNKKTKKRLFNIYLRHKILDLSVIKSAYFTNKTKYLELQNYISSQIDFLGNLIKHKQEFLEKFNKLI